MTFALNRIFWLDGEFLWTNHNSFYINVSELCIVLQIHMAEVLAANWKIDTKKRLATLNEEQFKKLLYEKDAKNTQRAT